MLRSQRLARFKHYLSIGALRPNVGGSVPVIAMSAFFTRADHARILNADFQACLPKPYTPDKLLETIRTVLTK
jgi:CheY-like chemotaxis protein